MSAPTDLIETFLREARWFGGKGRDFSVTGVHRLAELPHSGGPRVTIEIAEVSYADGDRELYQLPLAHYPGPQERLAHAEVGAWRDAELGECVGYDAVHDREAMAVWLRSFDAASRGVVEGPLDFHRLPGHELDLGTHSSLFAGEQSNSSVAFGEDALLKVFRKVTPGVNPDIAVHQVLTEHGSTHVAQLYGWLEAETDQGLWQLAMLQQFLRTASDGWELALASVRNLFAEGDLHADEVGGDFAGESARLGEALAEVHGTLREHFAHHVLERDRAAELVAGMHRRLDEALAVVPALAEHEAALRSTYDTVAGLERIDVQQVHGDLHLGQTLRTSLGWKIVDFEGEPAKPLAERVLPDSPWRDVAGMLRSFDYAPAVVAQVVSREGDDTGVEQRAYRSREWSARNRDAFVRAYAGRDLTATEDALLSAYVADKAVYECVYETRNRPSWVGIPLAAIARLD